MSPGPAKADGMRASLPEICLTAPKAGLKHRNQLPKTRLAPAKPIKPPSTPAQWRS